MQRLFATLPKTLSLATDARFLIGIVISWHAIIKAVGWLRSIRILNFSNDMKSQELKRIQISNLRVESELLAFKLARLLSPDTTSSKSTGDPSEQGTVSPSNMNNVPWESWQDNPVAYLEPSYLSKKFDTDINKINQNTKTEADQLRKENDILRCALESLSRDNQEMGSRLVEMAFSSGILSSEVINDEKITNDASYDPQSSIGTLSYDFLVDDNEALPSNTASPSSQAPEGPKTPLQLPSNATTSEEIYLSLGKSKSRLYDDI